MTYPAQDIGPWLREADILHINNEVPFAANCPPPFPRENNLVFCSKEKYIQLLEDIGTDVVELSGDHFQDWGDEAVHFTLDLYRERGWKYYGGGENLADGQKPLLMEHNGNRFAFLGCNAKGRGYASASETQPGAVFCNFDVLTTQIEELRQQGYLPIVTFQHLEYYDYKISPHLQEDFVKVAQAGAIIVSGSQAHQPHAFEFFNDAFLHYGLGNLFFDQLKEGIPMQQAFIDRHVFYDGKHISTELLTIRFVDYARSRPMTPEERAELLQTVFSLSIWHQP
jgi:poly-gamma-glutamate synthesis protein (capsule biosynthesis protein)